MVPARARDGAITVVRDISASASTIPFTRRLTLSVTRAVNEPLALTWTAGAEDFFLESSADPAQGWQELQASPSQANDLYRLLPDSGPGGGFFRLRRN